jgi:hypothetical protein
MSDYLDDTPWEKEVSARLVVPAQPVDATPTNQLIRQYFPCRTDLFGGFELSVASTH